MLYEPCPQFSEWFYIIPPTTYHAHKNKQTNCSKFIIQLTEDFEKVEKRMQAT
jgi:hypothetical protein